MNHTKILIALAIIFSSASIASATLVIDVGDHTLLANTPNQAVDVLISSAPSDPNVFGVELLAELGDGLGVANADLGNPPNEPVFQEAPNPVVDTTGGFDFSSSIFALNAGETGDGPIPGGAPQLIFGGAASTVAGGVDPNGVLVTLLIDTTGFTTPGAVFPLRLESFVSSFPGGATSTNLLDGVAGAIPGVMINNGTVTISAVPEPSSALFMTVASVGALLRRRRRRNR